MYKHRKTIKKSKSQKEISNFDEDEQSDIEILELIGNIGRLDNREIQNVQLHDNFLTNLKTCSEKNMKFMEKAKMTVSEVSNLVKKLSEKLEDLTYIFSCISVSYRQLEDLEKEEMSEIEPRLSSVYKNIEKAFPRWKKYCQSIGCRIDNMVGRSLDILEDSIKENLKVAFSFNK